MAITMAASVVVMVGRIGAVGVAGANQTHYKPALQQQLQRCGASSAFEHTNFPRAWQRSARIGRARSSSVVCMKVGTGARSEKIRTYNYKDNRVSDHRVKINFDLTSFLAGDIDGAVQSCAALEQQELLEELAASINKSIV